MGIGLAICAEILKLHDFIRYGVISKIGQSTKFFFTIPKQCTKVGRNLI